MKKRTLITIVTLLVLNCYGWAAIPVCNITVPKKMDTINKMEWPKGSKAGIAQMKSIGSLSKENYEKLRGRKLNLFQRILFNATKKSMGALLKYYGNGEGKLQKWKGLSAFFTNPWFLYLFTAGYISLKGKHRQQPFGRVNTGGSIIVALILVLILFFLLFLLLMKGLVYILKGFV